MPFRTPNSELRMKMFIPRLFIALCYRAVYKLHHALCLRPGAPLEHSKLIVVGSFRTGGAGKTPFCIWLCKHLAAQGNTVALLAHEYAFDEIKMLRQKFAGNESVQVFATRNRYRLAHELDRSQKFDCIVCDDGFEDSRLVGATTILLQWEDLPTKIPELWPCGGMRSLAKDHHLDHGKRSPMVRILRCEGGNPAVRFVIDKVLHFYSGKEFVKNSAKVNIVCGLGNPERFCSDLQDFGIEIGHKFFFKDHSKAFTAQFEKIIQNRPQETFVISEKDAARLPAEFIQKNEKSQIFVASQTTEISTEVAQNLF